MNKTIERFNEARLLDGDSETMEQFRAVSNAMKSIERELEYDEKKLRESGMYTDEGVEEHMRVKRQGMLNLLDSYERDVVAPHTRKAEEKVVAANRMVEFTSDEFDRALRRYNAGDQFKREMLAEALNGNKKVAAMLVSAERYEVDLAESTRYQLQLRATISDDDTKMAASSELEAAGFVSHKIETLRKSLEDKL